MTKGRENMLKFPELMFYAEAEGLLPTRAGKINAAINDIKNDPRSWVDTNDIEQILQKYGLSCNDLSDREIRYINASIR